MADVTLDHYVAGLIGVSILRCWYRDGDFNTARMAELDTVLNGRSEFPYSMKLSPVQRDLLEGYAEWAPTYDGPNPMIAIEDQVVGPMLERLVGPGVYALDAACGTGRHAATMRALGATCAGFDQSAAMLDVARLKVPEGRFEVAQADSVPFDDDTFDVAIISLALCHLEDPTKAVAELGRVLRPGGTLVITDPHPASAVLGGQAFYGGIAPDRPMQYVQNNYHSASTWLRAFRSAGLAVIDCIEVPYGEEQVLGAPVYALIPNAVRAAMDGQPALWLWELHTPDAP